MLEDEIIKTILLTFDIEEFDAGNVNESQALKLSYQGSIKVLKILKDNKIPVTLFITGTFAKKYPKLIKDFKKAGCELALHGYDHKHNYSSMDEKKALEFIIKNKKIVEKTAKTKVFGFRAPKLQAPRLRILKRAGLKYDSSLHPTYVPGRYNNLFRSKHITKKDSITEIPISVAATGLPFSWVWFRILGLSYAKFCTKSVFSSSDFVNIYFHPWEFVNLDGYAGFLFVKNTGNAFKNQLDDYIKWCKKKGYVFKTIKEYLNKKCK